MKNRYFEFKDIVISNCGDYILSGVSNLETGNATKRKTEYIDTDGTSYSDIFYSERVFEISGFIQAFDAEKMVRLKRKLISSCSLKEKFELKYFNREDSYMAECYFDKLPTFEKRKGWYLPFKLYLTIPGFYWLSAFEYKKKLFMYENEIADTFTLPCVFTSLINSVEVYNNGDCETYPVFTVACNEAIDGSTIVISNDTTEKVLTINYSTRANEVVTVDMFNQIITSNFNGNITNYVTLDSSFFELKKGKNKLSAVSLGNIINFSYRERFLGV